MDAGYIADDPDRPAVSRLIDLIVERRTLEPGGIDNPLFAEYDLDRIADLFDRGDVSPLTVGLPATKAAAMLSTIRASLRQHFYWNSLLDCSASQRYP
jgi:hypothetical protein